MRCPSPPSAVLSLFLLATTASGQPSGLPGPFPGGEVLLLEESTPAIWRWDRVNPPTWLVAGPALGSPRSLVVDRRGDLYFVDRTGGSLRRTDGSGAVITMTLFPAMGTPPQAFVPQALALDVDGSFIVAGTAGTGTYVLRVSRVGAITSVIPIPGVSSLIDLHVDPTGSYLAGNDVGSALLRVTPGGGVTTEQTGVPGLTAVALFPNGDGAVLSATLAGSSLLRVPRGGGVVSIAAGPTGLGVWRDVASDGQGDFLILEDGPTACRIVGVSAAGALLSSASLPIMNGASLAIAPRLVGPEDPANLPTPQFALGISMPDEANRAYLTFASTSVYPGLVLPSPDLRRSPLNPDSLFLSALSGAPSPVTAGWTGTLDATGRGLVSIDLTGTPAASLAGFRFFLQVAALDGSAPSGIGRITNLLTLRF